MRIVWPANPKQGDTFSYIDPIGGADWITWQFWKGSWRLVR